MQTEASQQEVTTELHARIKKLHWELDLATNLQSKGFTSFQRQTHVGGVHFQIAVCQLLLGEREPARQNFSIAAQTTYAALPIAPKPDPELWVRDALVHYNSALLCAILADDRPLAETYAKNPLEPGAHPRTHSLVEDRFHWALALPALVLGHDVVAKQHAKQANAVPEKKAWYPGIGNAIDAIAARDPANLKIGLEQVLAQHTAYAKATRSAVFNSPSAWICVPAMALARVAHWRGLNVPEPGGRHARIPFIIALFSGPPDSHVRERRPVTVDFLGQDPIRA